MVGMVPNVIVHKSDTSVGEGGGGKDKKVPIIGVLTKNTGPTTNNDEIDALSMAVSTLRRACYYVSVPFRS